MRIQGESSFQARGCHDICTLRKTRSGCGIRIVDAAIGRGERGDAARRAVGVLRVALGDAAVRRRRSARRRDRSPRAPRAPSVDSSSARPSPCATAIGSARAGHAGEQDRRALLDRHQRQPRLELLAAVAHEARPELGARDELAQVREHLAAVADAEREGVARARRTPASSSRARALNRIDFAQPSPAPSTSPYEKPPHAASPRKPSSRVRPARMSVMCTSTGSKPARWNAAAISI